MTAIALAIVVSTITDARAMSNPDAKDLFERSWQSPSETEKAILRAQITGAAPQSIYGIFSSAWLNEPDGKNEASIALYRECLAKDPTFLGCAYNLAGLSDDNASIALYKSICEKLPSFEDYRCYKEHLDSLIKQKDTKAIEVNM